jgi:DNA-binding XRE family transcriptional regulator
MKNIVRELREERGWTQANLADQLKISTRTVHAIETGRYDPSLPLAMAIAMAFHKSVELVFWSADVAVWGRSLNEYRAMFSLTDGDLRQRILGCGDGPASVNAELHALGGSRYISIDPVYALSGAEIESRVQESHNTTLSRIRQSAHAYEWNRFSDPDALGRDRLAVTACFLQDYAAGRAEGRYIEGSLPRLPFTDGEFDLCLCSHLIFLHSMQFSFDFHLAAMVEQLRVAREVRVFPVLDFSRRHSPHLDPVMRALADRGFACELVKVDHEFVKGANEMLKARPK